MITNHKIYEPFEGCKGLLKKRDFIDNNWSWHDPMGNRAGEFSYAYYILGFSSVYVIYDYRADKVLWFQLGERKKGRKVWEAMTMYTQKMFLFNIDWFIGE